MHKNSGRMNGYHKITRLWRKWKADNYKNSPQRPKNNSFMVKMISYNYYSHGEIDAGSFSIQLYITMIILKI